MLTHLSITNIVLIKSLSLSMEGGLTALTGETGAGKSILLDSLGLALGHRAEAGLLRKGAEQGSVTASFDVCLGSDIALFLQGQDVDTSDGTLILRRQITADGRTKAFINDRPVSVSLLREIGERLVDIHGQFETHGLMDSKNHGALLDNFGGLGGDVNHVAQTWKTWKAAQKSLTDHREKLAKAMEDQEYLEACVAELERLNPQTGEEDSLLVKRQALQHHEMIMSGLAESHAALENDKGGCDNVYKSLRALEKIADKAEDKIDPLITRLDGALSALRDIAGDIEMLAHSMNDGDDNLEYVDDRIHELRAIARKHNCMADQLPEMLTDMQNRLSSIHNDDKMTMFLQQDLEKAQADYNKAASILSGKRIDTARNLSRLVMDELPDLKLGNAVFRVAIDAALTPSQNGIDDVRFLIKTNAGGIEGDLGKVASGGELSRIMLALKVVLSNTSPVPVMVFDEVDSGIGGATADAVGVRLARMSGQCQILVVTHSPQVAAKADHHWIVSKFENKDETTETTVTALTEEAVRIDEIARMVSGASLTDEARAAAKVLRDVA